MKLEQEFTEALEGTIRAAKSKGYIPSYFIQMLAKHGGVNTAKRLLADKDTQSGLFTLWELGLLHESMEAIVLIEKFQSLFSLEELQEARNRLESLDYFI
jgi:hypothetical protein